MLNDMAGSFHTIHLFNILYNKIRLTPEHEILFHTERINNMWLMKSPCFSVLLIELISWSQLFILIMLTKELWRQKGLFCKSGKFHSLGGK